MPDSTLNRIGAHVWRVDDRVEAQTNDDHGESRTETGLLLAKVSIFRSFNGRTCRRLRQDQGSSPWWKTNFLLSYSSTAEQRSYTP